MNGFYQFKKIIISELNEKGRIKEEDIGLLDSGCIDLVDDCLEFDFCLRNDDALYTFWHNYRHDVGNIVKNNEQNQEVYKSWGDWSIYESGN
ncbi:hypothetical protein [Bacillus cereus group sp. TH152-1LC]|uniref:hypothetical protein n=1 Tax=Bacillus cereus group sp. TH152-1LC TaxID=3018060 RepID=UPI0022E6F4B6|nr:hypothetical protein [Bacillus cereus group sp. TH152-1LC]MDA1675749.1 hypothetical protein [Bacillus cereus group sp. TH152-1LC]